jgi:hypothetical protein
MYKRRSIFGYFLHEVILSTLFDNPKEVDILGLPTPMGDSRSLFGKVPL